MTVTPASMPSGRSWASRIITAGKPSRAASSVSVPLSDRTQKALDCSLHQSNSPKGFRN